MNLKGGFLGVKRVIYDSQLLAIIIDHTYHKSGVSFFTPDELSQQVAYMQHSKGHQIDAHVHNHIVREVHYTEEVLVLRKGKLRVDFYDDNRQYIESHVLEAGDIILLVSGGHGFEVLEDVEMFEIKQGPYAGEADKTRFEAIARDKITLK